MSLLVKGATSFLALTDTPDDYAGAAQRQARVNLTEDALEFVVGSKFTTTKVFDGETASPPTINVSPLSMIPYTHFAGQSYGVAGFGAIVIGDYLYVFGGHNIPTVDQYTNKCYRLHLDSLVWERLSNMPNTYSTTWKGNPVGYHNGKIYFLTYLSGPGVYNYRVLSYEISTDNWTTESSLPSLSEATNLCCFACSDALYVYQSKYVGHRFDKMDYATRVWTPLTALGSNPEDLVGGVVGDEIYLVAENYGNTQKYNKAGNSWTDTGHARPFSLVNGGGHNYIETQNCIWARSHEMNPKYYRYTPVGGWVHQFTEGRDTYECGYILERSSTGQFYVLWSNGWNLHPDPENPWAGAILYCQPDGVWHLLTQEFNVGDLLILYENAGIPVKVELGGEPLFTGSGMDTVYIVKAGSYYFSLSKDFDMSSVKIYRSVWG